MIWVVHILTELAGQSVMRGLRHDLLFPLRALIAECYDLCRDPLQ
jgi:hypothetical protein